MALARNWSGSVSNTALSSVRRARGYGSLQGGLDTIDLAVVSGLVVLRPLRPSATDPIPRYAARSC